MMPENTNFIPDDAENNETVEFNRLESKLLHKKKKYKNCKRKLEKLRNKSGYHGRKISKMQSKMSHYQTKIKKLKKKLKKLEKILQEQETTMLDPKYSAMAYAAQNMETLQMAILGMRKVCEMFPQMFAISGQTLPTIYLEDVSNIIDQPEDEYDK